MMSAPAHPPFKEIEMKKILVLFIAFQVTPVFAGNFSIEHKDVCARYGCTIPPVPSSFEPFEFGGR